MFSSFIQNTQERLLTKTATFSRIMRRVEKLFQLKKPLGLKSTLLDLNLHPAAALHRGNEGGPLLQNRDLPTSR